MTRRLAVIRYSRESEEAAFHNSILAEPTEKTNYLVYADWLEENGMPGHAEMIRREVKDRQDRMSQQGLSIHPWISTSLPPHRVVVSHAARDPRYVNAPGYVDDMLSLHFPMEGSGNTIYMNPWMDRKDSKRLFTQLQQEGATVHDDTSANAVHREILESYKEPVEESPVNPERLSRREIVLRYADKPYTTSAKNVVRGVPQTPTWMTTKKDPVGGGKVSAFVPGSKTLHPSLHGSRLAVILNEIKDRFGAKAPELRKLAEIGLQGTGNIGHEGDIYNRIKQSLLRHATGTPSSIQQQQFTPEEANRMGDIAKQYNWHRVGKGLQLDEMVSDYINSIAKDHLKARGEQHRAAHNLFGLGSETRARPASPESRRAFMEGLKAHVKAKGVGQESAYGMSGADVNDNMLLRSMRRLGQSEEHARQLTSAHPTDKVSADTPAQPAWSPTKRGPRVNPKAVAGQFSRRGIVMRFHHLPGEMMGDDSSYIDLLEPHTPSNITDNPQHSENDFQFSPNRMAFSRASRKRSFLAVSSETLEDSGAEKYARLDKNTIHAYTHRGVRSDSAHPHDTNDAVFADNLEDADDPRHLIVRRDLSYRGFGPDIGPSPGTPSYTRFWLNLWKHATELGHERSVSEHQLTTNHDLGDGTTLETVMRHNPETNSTIYLHNWDTPKITYNAVLTPEEHAHVLSGLGLSEVPEVPDEPPEDEGPDGPGGGGSWTGDPDEDRRRFARPQRVNTNIGGVPYVFTKNDRGWTVIPNSNAIDRIGRAYQVSCDDTGNPVSCTCPDHLYRRRECKHMRAVKEFGGSGQPREEEEKQPELMSRRYAAYRAPAGGLVARGTHYKGGEMVPDMTSEFMNPPQPKTKKKPLIVSFDARKLAALKSKWSMRVKKMPPALAMSDGTSQPVSGEKKTHYSRKDSAMRLTRDRLQELFRMARGRMRPELHKAFNDEFRKQAQAVHDSLPVEQQSQHQPVLDKFNSLDHAAIIHRMVGGDPERASDISNDLLYGNKRVFWDRYDPSKGNLSERFLNYVKHNSKESQLGKEIPFSDVFSQEAEEAGGGSHAITERADIGMRKPVRAVTESQRSATAAAIAANKAKSLAWKNKVVGQYKELVAKEPHHTLRTASQKLGVSEGALGKALRSVYPDYERKPIPPNKRHLDSVRAKATATSVARSLGKAHSILEQYPKLKEQGLRDPEIAERLGISRSNFYRLLALHGKGIARTGGGRINKSNNPS